MCSIRVSEPLARDYTHSWAFAFFVLNYCWGLVEIYLFKLRFYFVLYLDKLVHLGHAYYKPGKTRVGLSLDLV